MIHPRLFRAMVAGAVLVVLWLGVAPARAQSLPDPAVCASGDGWIKVVTDSVVAMGEARKAGRISEQSYTDLSVWVTQMQEYLLVTNNTKVMCELFIGVRKDWGF